MNDLMALVILSMLVATGCGMVSLGKSMCTKRREAVGLTLMAVGIMMILLAALTVLGP